MEKLKVKLSSLIISLLAMSISFAQDNQPTMFTVHTDNVNFSMMQQYEEVAKEMKDNFVKHDIKDMNWTAISIEDGRYVYVSPINSMADLDKNPMASLYDKMGKDAADAMFNKMDQCYDSHSDYVVYYIPELSYLPEGSSTEGKNHREYHFLYYTPKNGAEMKNAMKAVKKLFEDKGIKNGYSIFHSGFGSEESYYMVSIAGMDDLEIAQGGKENDKAFGDEGKATFYNVIKLTSRYDQVEGTIRPDLSYSPKQ